MNQEEILAHVDHTLLAPTATWDDIAAIIDDGIAYKTASVCIPPSFVRRAAEYADGQVKICTVVGFPNGYNSSLIKALETRDAVAAGADEIDMVVNLGLVKEKDWDAVMRDIASVRNECRELVLKVIIETCLLDDDEKKMLCKVVGDAGADYIKTSTGFSTGGATFDDIALMAENVPEGLLIKAAGGISDFDDAEKFLSLGADRLGTSRLVKIAKQA